MRADFDLYVNRNSWLHRLDPRVKLAFVLEGIFILLLWPSLWVALAALLLCMVALWRSQIPAAQIMRPWRLMAPLMLIVFVLTALFGDGPGPIWLRLGPLSVTASAVRQGVLLAVRLLAMALVFYLWLLTTGQASMVRGFLALRMPYAWGLTLALALRYLPIFAGLFEQVRDAQQARGLDLERGGLWQRLLAYRPVLVALVIAALRNSERLGWALEARALGATGVRRTVFRPLRLRLSDALTLAVLFCILVAAILLRIL